MAEGGDIDETKVIIEETKVIICSSELSINCILFKKLTKYKVIKLLGGEKSNRIY